MTTHLTRIALGTIALFFIAMIAGAAMLSSKSRGISADQLPAIQEKVSQKPSVDKQLILDRSSLAFKEPKLVEEIRYFGGRIRDDDSLHDVGNLHKQKASRKDGVFLGR